MKVFFLVLLSTVPCFSQIVATDSQVLATAGNFACTITKDGGWSCTKKGVQWDTASPGLNNGADASATYHSDGNMVDIQTGMVAGVVSWSAAVQPNGGSRSTGNGVFGSVSTPPKITIHSSNTQALLDFHTAADTTISISTSINSDGTIGPSLADTDPKLFPDSNSTTRPECIVDPGDATHRWCVVGIRQAQLAADGVTWVSRALPANTQLYASVGGGPAVPFQTSNIAPDETLNEPPDANPDGTPRLPTVPQTRDFTFTDPKTGANIQSIFLSTDTNGHTLNLYDGANKHMAPAVMLTPPGLGPGWLASFPSDNGPQTLYYFEKDKPATHYLGKQVGTQTWPSCDAAGTGALDDLDPTYAYAIGPYRTGGAGCPGNTTGVLIRSHYTGDFGVTPVAPNTNAQLTFDLMTPDPNFSIPQLIHAFDPTFDPTLFPNCGIDDSFKKGAALIECRMGIQGTPVWYAVLNLGDRKPLGQCTNCLHITAAFFGAANPKTRNTGSHSGTMLDSGTLAYLVPGGFEGNTQGGSGAAPYLGPYATTLTAAIGPADTVLSVSGQPTNMSSLVPPTTLVPFATGDRVLLCPASTLSAPVAIADTSIQLVNPAWTKNGMRISILPDPTGTEEVVTVTSDAGVNPVPVTRGSAGTNISAHAPGTNAGFWYNDCGSQNSLANGVEMATLTAAAPGSITISRDTPTWHGASAWPAGTNIITQGGPYRDGSHYLWWDFTAAPRGEPTGYIAEINPDFWGNHADFGTAMIASEHYHYRKSTTIQAGINQPTTGTVNGGPAYNGVLTPAPGNTTSAYPVANKNLASDDWFLDMPGVIGGGNLGYSAAAVPGMTQVYELTFCPGGPGQCGGTDGFPHRKMVPTVAQSGRHVLRDVSAPGGLIAQGAAGAWTYFVANAPGEGVPGSVPGKVYFNVPSLQHFGCNNDEGGGSNENDICIFDAPMGAGALIQMSTNPAATGWGRRLSSTLSPFGFRLNKELAKPTPDGNLIFFRSGPNNMFMLNAGALPWISAKDANDRTKYIPVTITLSSVPAGTATAVIAFGYGELGGFCTSRQERCLAISSTVPAVPFQFELTDTYTRPDCHAGCAFAVPAMSSHVVLTTALYYDVNGKLIGSVNLAPQVVAPYGYTTPSSPVAAIKPSQVGSFTVPSPSGGDTQFYTWTSPTTRAGNWGGGAIVGTYNDYTGLGCGSSSICLYEITGYNSNAPSWTTSAVNSMTSYLGSSDLSCYDHVHQMKSRKPFAFGGVIFLPIFCMTNGTPFDGFQSGFVVSPDGGSHWCNVATFNAHSGSPGCDSSNWQANGDNPTSAAGFQWPLADGTNKMTRMQIVDFLCQDNSINCPVAPGVDPAYLYFMTSPSVSSDITYLARVPKSIGWAKIMAGSSDWQVYNAGSWDSNVQNATDISNGVPMNSCCSSWSYFSDFKVFAAWIHGGKLFATAPAPWGPWTQQPNVDFSANMGFPTPIPGLCPKYDTPGSVTCTIASSPAGDSLALLETNLGAASPTAPIAAQCSTVNAGPLMYDFCQRPSDLAAFVAINGSYTYTVAPDGLSSVYTAADGSVLMVMP